MGYIFAGLGCPNGCDFCVTSHYFKRRHIKLLPTGQSVMEAIRRLLAARPDVNSVWISDEDFLQDHARAREFLEAVRASGLSLSLSIFASVRSLSRFTMEELVEMGIDWVWIGFEAKKAGYAKMRGTGYGTLFRELRRHGITVMSSMILGFDYQTPKVIREEFEELMGYRPSLCQFLIYGPAMCTPASEKYKDRMLGIDYRFHDGFYLGFDHPFIDPHTMGGIQKELYREEYRRLGPTIYRVVQDWFEGYRTLKDHPNPRLRAKGAHLGAKAHRSLVSMGLPRRFFKGDAGVVEGIEEMGRRIEESTGGVKLHERAFAALLPVAAKATELSLKYDLFQQPAFMRRVFRDAGRSRNESRFTLPARWGVVG